MKPKVFVTRPLPAAVVDMLSAACDVQVHPADIALKPAQLAEACREAEGLLAVGVRVNEEVLTQAGKLRVVANCGVGYDNIDVEACTRRKIVVTAQHQRQAAFCRLGRRQQTIPLASVQPLRLIE